MQPLLLQSFQSLLQTLLVIRRRTAAAAPAATADGCSPAAAASAGTSSWRSIVVVISLVVRLLRSAGEQGGRLGRLLVGAGVDLLTQTIDAVREGRQAASELETVLWRRTGEEQTNRQKRRAQTRARSLSDRRTPPTREPPTDHRPLVASDSQLAIPASPGPSIVWQSERRRGDEEASNTHE